MTIRLKRVYDPPSRDDGQRILVDRLWPRGVSKDHAALSDWMKDAAPSAALRKWFGHDPERWDAFRERYAAELKDNPCVDRLRDLASSGTVTLLYGARDEHHNHAIVLADQIMT